MKRRVFVNKGVLAGLGISSFFTTRAQKKKPSIQGKFMHMVFFWLKDKTDISDFKSSTAALMEAIPEVISYHVGEPAGTPREVVDNSYTVCLIATFDSKAAQDAYQIHPVHQQYVTDNNDKWTKVQIYDSWNS